MKKEIALYVFLSVLFLCGIAYIWESHPGETADTKISAMTAVVTPATTDIFPVVQGGANKYETIAQALGLKIGTLTTGKWCAESSGKIVCDQDAPSAGMPSPFEAALDDALGANVGAGLYLTGSSLTAGNAYYMAAGGLTAAKADAVDTVPAICIAISTTKCATHGAYQFSSSQSWTAGQVLYVSAATAGAITTVTPSASGNQVQRVGVALAAGTIMWTPSLDVVEIK